MFIWRAGVREGSTVVKTGAPPLPSTRSSRAGRQRVLAAMMTAFLCLSLLPTVLIVGPSDLFPRPMPCLPRRCPS